MTRQYLIPGEGYVNETRLAQYMLADFGYVNETVAPANTPKGSAPISPGAGGGPSSTGYSQSPRTGAGTPLSPALGGGG